MKNIEDEDDFGFSFANEPDIITNSQTSITYEEKFNKLKEMIMPLLENLMSNPDKEYILWPDRVEKIKKFIAKIEKL